MMALNFNFSTRSRPLILISRRVIPAQNVSTQCSIFFQTSRCLKILIRWKNVGPTDTRSNPHFRIESEYEIPRMFYIANFSGSSSRIIKSEFNVTRNWVRTLNTSCCVFTVEIIFPNLYGSPEMDQKPSKRASERENRELCFLDKSIMSKIP